MEKREEKRFKPTFLYGFILLCGFGSLLVVVVFPEILSKTRLFLHPIGKEILELKKTFLEERIQTMELEHMRKRANFRWQSCRKSKLGAPSIISKQTANKILVDDKRKILFCYIPKVACSNWKRVFLNLLGIIPREEVNNAVGVHGYRKHDLVYLSKFGLEERLQKLKSHKKIMFVRDPIDRLVSAYRDKLLHPEVGNKFIYVKEMTAFYEKHPLKRTSINTIKQNDISFQMFLQFLVDQHQVGQRFDPHYDLYDNLCEPCIVHYNYIGDFDNLEIEANAIFHELSINIPFPPRRGNSTSQKTVELVDRYTSSVPKNLLNEVLYLYSNDFKYYGYNFTKWLT